MPRAIIATVVAGVSLLAALADGAGATNAKAIKLEAVLRGSNERPAAPAANRGRAELRLNAATGRVCWEFRISRIDGKAMQAHIHKGRRGVSGNIVAPARGELQAPGLHDRGQGDRAGDRQKARGVLRERPQRQAPAGRDARPADSGGLRVPRCKGARWTLAAGLLPP